MVFNLDSRELIERNGIATQFVFYVNNIDALTAYVLSSVNEEMLHHEDFIVSNIRIGFKQEYEYIGAVIIYAE